MFLTRLLYRVSGQNHNEWKKVFFDSKKEIFEWLFFKRVVKL